MSYQAWPFNFLGVKIVLMKKKIFAFIFGGLLLLQALVMPKMVMAQDIHQGCSQTQISTAIGCLDVLSNQNTFLGDLLKWAVGIGGGLAFLLIVYAGFMIMTSAGNPERLKAGQELLTSAISGLILLIFSIFVLRFIGVDILGLNKFGFSK